MGEILSHLKDLFLILIAEYGYWGILGFSVMVAVFQPLAPDIVILGAGGLGLNRYWAALIGIGGTLVGAMMGHVLGKSFGASVLVKWLRVREKYLLKGEELLRRHGVWAVAVVAFSPMPLREVCWTAGIFGMPLLPFAGAIIIAFVPKYLGLAFLGGIVGDFLREKLLSGFR